MKALITITLAIGLVAAQPVQAQSWWDSFKSAIGLGEEKAKEANVGDMVSMLTDQLNIDKKQATGGLGSLFALAQSNLSKDQFGQLSEILPGASGLLKSVPDISKIAGSTGALGGIIDKAASMNKSLQALNTVKKQFEALGLKPEMIAKFAQMAQQYLGSIDGEKAQQAKQLLSQGLGKLLG